MADDLLLNRKYVLTIGTLQITGLRVSFTVKKTAKPQPNTAEIKVYNLSEDHRKAIQTEKALTIQLDAGYEAGTSVIFLGDLKTDRPAEYNGPDVISTLGGADGGKKHQKARVHVAHVKGTPITSVLNSLVLALGVLPGNSTKAIAAIQSSGLGDRFSLGTVLSGQASLEMTRILRSVGYTWSIQNGALQILQIGKALSTEAISLAVGAGLLGSPSVDKDGYMTCRSFIVPNAFPGRLLVLKSRDVNGQYKIEETSHTGDSESGPWYIDYKAKKY